MNREDREFIANRIRCQYIEEENTALDDLKRLDAEVRRPATIFGYTYGSFAAIVMGAGMSLVMTELGGAAALVPGIIIGVLGLAAAISTYPIYRRILVGRKKKYADRILALSGEILGETQPSQNA